MAKNDWEDVPLDDDWEDVPLPSISKGESFARGAGQGVTFGFQDELSSAVEPGIDLLLDKVLGKSGAEAVSNLPEESYSSRRDGYRGENRAAQEANPGTYLTGQIAGGILPTVGTGGSSLASAVGTGAATGGLSGAGLSEADLTEGEFGDFSKDVALSSALGAGAGALGYGVGKGIEKAASKVSPRVREYLEEVARRRAVKSVGGERGTFKKLLGGKVNTDKIDDLGQRIIDNEVITPFGSTDDMVGKMNELSDSGWGKMKYGFEQVDDTGLGKTVDPFTGEMGKGGHVSPYAMKLDVDELLTGFDDDVAQKVAKTFGDRIPKNGEKLTLQQAQDLKNAMKKFSNWNNKISPSQQENAFRQVEGIISSKIDEAASGVESTLGENASNILKQGRSEYQTASQIQEPLLNKSAREMGNKTLGLTDWLWLAAGVGEDGTFKVPLGYAAKKYGETYGNQQLALMANKVAKSVQGNPQLQRVFESMKNSINAGGRAAVPAVANDAGMYKKKNERDQTQNINIPKMGKFTPHLEAAKARGPEALAATDYVLGMSNPEYRELKNKTKMEDTDNEY